MSPTIPPCELVREELSAYFDGRVSDADRARVDSHLASCDGCREELRSLQSMVRALRELPRVPPPPELLAGVQKRLRREGESAVIVRGVRWAFPEGQGRVLATAASMLGFAMLVAVGLFIYGPDGVREPAVPAAQDRVAVERPSVLEPSAPPLALADAEAQAAAEPASSPAEAKEEDAEGPRLDGAKPKPAVTVVDDELARGLVASPSSEPPAPPAVAVGEASGRLAPSEAGAPEPERAARNQVAKGFGSEARVDKLGEARLSESTPDASASVAASGAGLAKDKKRDARQAAPSEPGRARAMAGGRSAQLSESTGIDEDGLARFERKVLEEEDERDLEGERSIYFRVDADTGWFVRNGGPSAHREAGLFASLHLLGRSDGGSPLMRMVLPSEGWSAARRSRDTGAFAPAPSLGPAGDAPASGEDVRSAGLPELRLSVEVTAPRCDPLTPGGLGSDANPLPVSDGIMPPLLDAGEAPAVSGALDGVRTVIDVVVARDGSVSRVAIVSAPRLPAGLIPMVKRSVLRWHFAPGQCDDAPVATVFRMELRWSRTGVSP